MRVCACRRSGTARSSTRRSQSQLDAASGDRRAWRTRFPRSVSSFAVAAPDGRCHVPVGAGEAAKESTLPRRHANRRLGPGASRDGQGGDPGGEAYSVIRRRARILGTIGAGPYRRVCPGPYPEERLDSTAGSARRQVLRYASPPLRPSPKPCARLEAFFATSRRCALFPQFVSSRESLWLRKFGSSHCAETGRRTSATSPDFTKCCLRVDVQNRTVNCAFR